MASHHPPFSTNSRPSTSEVCSRLISRLPLRDLNHITHLLYQGTEEEDAAAWWHRQAELVLELPPRLRQPKNVLSRLAISACRSASKRGLEIRGLSQCADLCEVHAEMDPRLVRALMVLLGNEVTVRVERFRRLRRQGCEFPPGTWAWLRRLDTVPSMWMDHPGRPLDLTRGSPPRGTEQRRRQEHSRRDTSREDHRVQRCEACILAAVGGRPQVLADLRAGMLARMEARQRSGDADPAPRFLRVVDMWLAWFPPVCRVAIRDASEALSRGIEQLNAERRRQKRERTRSHTTGRRCRKRGQKDERGLPISNAQSSHKGAKDGKSSLSASHSGASTDDLVGYVHCDVMSRRPDYNSSSSFTSGRESLFQGYEDAADPFRTFAEQPSDEAALSEVDEEPFQSPFSDHSSASSESSSDSSEVSNQDDGSSVARGDAARIRDDDRQSRTGAAAPSEFTHPSLAPIPLQVGEPISDAVETVSEWTDESVATWLTNGRHPSTRPRSRATNRAYFARVSTIPEDHTDAGGTGPEPVLSHYQQRRAAPPSSTYSVMTGRPRSPTGFDSRREYNKNSSGSIPRVGPTPGFGRIARNGQELREGNLARLDRENSKKTKRDKDNV